MQNAAPIISRQSSHNSVAAGKIQIRAYKTVKATSGVSSTELYV